MREDDLEKGKGLVGVCSAAQALAILGHEGRAKKEGEGRTDMRVYVFGVTERECGGGGAKGGQRAIEEGAQENKRQQRDKQCCGGRGGN